VIWKSVKGVLEGGVVDFDGCGSRASGRARIRNARVEEVGPGSPPGMVFEGWERESGRRMKYGLKFGDRVCVYTLIGFSSSFHFPPAEISKIHCPPQDYNSQLRHVQS
jgi:hypothetical protein